jgi:hypothetical protein
MYKTTGITETMRLATAVTVAALAPESGIANPIAPLAPVDAAALPVMA